MSGQSENVFDRPSSDWTDHELEVGLAVIAQRSDELHGPAVVLAEELDRRVELGRAVDDGGINGLEGKR